MSTTTDLTTLKINYLTQAQYDTAKSQGLINDDELYLTPAADSGINDVTVDGVSVVTDNVAEITMPTVPTSEDMTSQEVSDFVNSLDAQGGGLKIERGSASFNVTGMTEASTYIAFSEQYDTAPTVMVTLMTSYNRRIDVSAVSTYGFTVRGALLSGTSEATIPFMWLAVGN